MKLRFEAKKKSRIKNSLYGISHCGDLWYNSKTNWVQNPDFSKGGYGTCQPCKSVRAFRRKLKKAPKGERFILRSKWKRHDVYGVGCGFGIKTKVV
jgi:hypothetical protein